MVFFEGIAEMPDIFIAQHVSCFIDFTVGGDQFGGLIHFQLGDVGNIGLPCFALKQCAEIRGIHVKIAGDGIQGKIFHDMVGDELEDLLNLKAGIGTCQIKVVQCVNQPGTEPVLKLGGLSYTEYFMYLKAGFNTLQLQAIHIKQNIFNTGIKDDQIVFHVIQLIIQRPAFSKPLAGILQCIASFPELNVGPYGTFDFHELLGL